MLFGNPVRGAIHVDARYYSTHPDAWKRPSGNRDAALTHDFGPSSVSAEPKVIWPGGETDLFGRPIAKGTYTDFHQGIDISTASCGKDVVAARAGTVAYSSTDSSGSKTIIVDHGGGFRTWYAHLASRSVARGAKVSKGQKIGTIGDTGNAIGCHLHFAVEWTGFPGTVVAIRGTSRSYRKFVDPWSRLEQNVRIRPISIAPAIRIRSELSLASSAIFAEAKDGRIVRKADSVDLGAVTDWLDWNGDASGPEYVGPDGSKSTTWSRIFLDGADRWIAREYAELSKE